MALKDPETLLAKPEPSLSEVMDKAMNGFFDGFRETCVFFAAVNLRLFEHAAVPLTVPELSERMRVDGRLTEAFCDILVSMELLDRDGDRYVNTKASSLYFTETSPFSQLTHVGQISKRIKRWTRIEESLRSGGIDAESDLFTEKWITAIGEGAIGGEILDTIQAIGKHVDLAQMGSLIDVGGGHGLYAIAFKHKYPNLRCALFDQVMVAPVARRNIEEYGVDVSVQEGDFYKDEIVGTYDVVFSSYNRSGMDPAMAPIVNRLMTPNGFLVIKRPIMKMFNPMKFIEWNIIKEANASAKKKNPSISRDYDEYIGSMASMGVKVVSREMLDSTTEMIVLRKAGI